MLQQLLHAVAEILYFQLDEIKLKERQILNWKKFNCVWSSWLPREMQCLFRSVYKEDLNDSDEDSGDKSEIRSSHVNQNQLFTNVRLQLNILSNGKLITSIDKYFDFRCQSRWQRRWENCNIEPSKCVSNTLKFS